MTSSFSWCRVGRVEVNYAPGSSLRGCPPVFGPKWVQSRGAAAALPGGSPVGLDPEPKIEHAIFFWPVGRCQASRKKYSTRDFLYTSSRPIFLSSRTSFHFVEPGRGLIFVCFGFTRSRLPPVCSALRPHDFKNSAPGFQDSASEFFAFEQKLRSLALETRCLILNQCSLDSNARTLVQCNKLCVSAPRFSNQSCMNSRSPFGLGKLGFPFFNPGFE